MAKSHVHKCMKQQSVPVSNNVCIPYYTLLIKVNTCTVIWSPSIPQCYIYLSKLVHHVRLTSRRGLERRKLGGVGEVWLEVKREGDDLGAES